MKSKVLLIGLVFLLSLGCENSSTIPKVFISENAKGYTATPPSATSSSNFPKDLSENDSKIKGAFGYKFGEYVDIFDSKYIIKKDKLRNGVIDAVEVIKGAKKPFYKYILKINPKTYKLHSIVAYAPANTHEECDRMSFAYKEAIIKKYNLKEYAIDGLYVLVGNGNRVFVSCSVEYKTFFIEYEGDMAEEARKDATSLQIEKIDINEL